MWNGIVHLLSFQLKAISLLSKQLINKYIPSMLNKNRYVKSKQLQVSVVTFSGRVCKWITVCFLQR